MLKSIMWCLDRVVLVVPLLKKTISASLFFDMIFFVLKNSIGKKGISE